MSLRSLLLFPMLLALLAAAAQGQAAGQDRPAEALQFRRVYAPAGRVQDWPLGNDKYVWMDPAEFERLLKIAQTETPGNPALLAAQPDTAEYRAVLVGDELTAGQATLEVVQPEQTYTLLPLDPCNLAIGDASWSGGEPRPTILGLGADGKLQVLVEDSGRFAFEWSLAGQRDADGVLCFSFELPACPTNRLVLDLPEGLSPQLDHGRVSEAGGADEGLRRWQIELGGRHRFRLCVLSAGADRQRQLPLLRESVRYRFSPQGLEVLADLTFETSDRPLEQLTLTLDGQLQLASARYGDTSVPFSPTSTAGAESTTRIALRLPQLADDAQPVLRLRALAPLVTDRRWQLPRIRAEETLWQEGSATLQVPAPMVIRGLLPVGCRQTGMGLMPGSRMGESAQFQYLTADATVEVVLSRRSAPLQLASGTTIGLSERWMTARVVADFRVSDDPRFSLQADLSRWWVIDSVESIPADALEDWDAVEDRPPGALMGLQQTLVVRLAKPLSPARPVRLVINARRLGSALRGSAGIADLMPLRFQAPEDSRRLVAVRPVGPYQLRLSGTEQLNRIDPRSLSAAERSLFAELPDDLLFEDDPGTSGLRISLRSRPAGYAASLAVEAIVGQDTLQEDYTLRCVPESPQVERVLVLFSHRRQEGVRWTLANAGALQVSARRLSDEEQSAAGLVPETGTPESPAPEPEAWEVTLSGPASGLLEIHGTRETRLDNLQPISLISLPEATSQQATLVVRSPQSGGVRVVSQRLVPIPAETVSSGQYATVRATYRYDPLQDVVGLSEAAVTVSRSSEGATPPAWVWSSILESRYTPSGAGRHLATYRLQNSCGGALQVVLPSGAETDIQDVWVDEERVAVHRLAGGSANHLSIELPQGEKFPTVSILLSTPAASLGTIGSLSPPLPEVNLKVLAQDWKVWLPPGYEAYDPAIRRQACPAAGPSWSQRLLGPLGRSLGSEAFDPLAAIGRLPPQAGEPDQTPATVETPQAESHGTSQPPWTDARWAEAEPADNGWNVCRMAISGTDPARLEYVHRPTMLLLGSVTFLMVIALGWWAVGPRPGVLGTLAGGFACVALLLPDAYVPIASGAVLGTLFCLGCWLVRRVPEAERSEPQGPLGDRSAPTQPPGGISGAIPAGVLVFVALAVGAACAVARGEQPAPVSPPSSAPRVFIPIDQNRQPTGDRYYVPQEIYTQLYRREAAATNRPYGWLIKTAVYRGALSRETISRRLVIDQLKAEFTLEVFDAAARVRLPIGREGAELLPNGILLDGRPIQAQWETQSGGLLVDVTEPGEYHLELALHPTSRNDGSTTQFELQIPALATSWLDLSVPRGVPTVEVPSALGAVRAEDQPPRIVAELGPSDRLTIRWPDGAVRAATASVTEVEELLWLKVEPGSVVLSARLKFNAPGGQLREVRLAADPRLRLAPLEGKDLPAVEVQSVPGQQQTLLLQWPHPISGQAVLDLRFTLTGTSGVDDLRLPQLRVLDAKSTRRWLAVSVDPDLEHREQPSGQFDTVAVADFLASWGQSQSPPLLAYRLPSGESAWSMSTRLREPATKVSQKLALSFDRGSAEVEFDAELTPAGGYIFQHRLLVPATLQVEEISVTEDGVSRVARWSQDERGNITVFLTEQMTRPQRLSLRGLLSVWQWLSSPGPPPAWDATIPLPVLRIEGGQLESSTIELFRRPAVQVELASAEGLEEVEDPAIQSGDPEWGRPVGRFRALGYEPIEATLRVGSNRPMVRAEQVTWLRRQSGSWTAQTQCRFRVNGGLVDEIRIDVPDPLKGPYEVRPAATFKQIDTPGENRQLVVWPAAAIEGDYQLSISSPLTLPPGQRPTGALAAINGQSQFGFLFPGPPGGPGPRGGGPRGPGRPPDQVTRLLALPREVDGQPIGWKTQGLRETELPEGFAASPDTEAMTIYRMVDRDFEAVLSRDQIREQSRVRLADVQIAWRADLSCAGVARFDLEPGRASDCLLWLPAEYRLLEVSVAGVPTEPVPEASAPTGPTAWRVPLGPAHLPQRVEVLFSGRLSEPASAASRSFRAPILDALPVEQTLWTVIGPSQCEPGQPQRGAPVSLQSHELTRLSSIAAVIESASRLSAEDPQDMLRWYRRWAHRLAAVRAALLLQPADGDWPTKVRDEIEAIDGRQLRIAAQLGVADEYQRLVQQGAAEADNLADLWQPSPDHNPAATRCTITGRAASITLNYRPSRPSDLPRRLTGAAALAVLIGLVAVGVRRRALGECFKRWPQAIGVAVGLAWWLFAWPSVLGWVIVLLSLATLLRRNWRYAATAPGTSIISLETRQH